MLRAETGWLLVKAMFSKDWEETECSSYIQGVGCGEEETDSLLPYLFLYEVSLVSINNGYFPP